MSRAPVDAVLLVLPASRLDGLDALARIKRAKPAVPVIVMTGRDRAILASEALRRGAEGCVTKPFAAGATIDPPRVAAGDAPCASILLVGADVPLLATLKAVLGPSGATEIAAGATRAFELCQRARPRVCVVDDSMDWDQMVNVVNAVRRISTTCAIAIGYQPDHDGVARLDGLLSVKPDAMIPKPYDWNHVRTWAQLSIGVPGVAAAPRVSAPVTRTLHHVVTHYRTVTLDTAASAAAVSAGYIAHLFPRELGTTFWHHVTNVRLELVQDLMSRTTDKLAYIASVAGFSDAPNLWRVFHRRYAQSAGDYRRAALEGAWERTFYRRCSAPSVKLLV